METKLSGMPVSSVGKTNSLLPKEAADVKDITTRSSKPVSVRLNLVLSLQQKQHECLCSFH